MKENLLRLLDLIETYVAQGVLRDEFEVFAGSEEDPIETIADLIETMESEMSYWDN
jgi:hypothetical protein